MIYRLIVLMLSVIFVMCSAGHAQNFANLEVISEKEGLSQGNISALLQDNEGYLWIGTLQGLNFYDGYRATTIDSKDHALKIKGIDALYQDKRNEIWVSTDADQNFIINKPTGDVREIHLPLPKDSPTNDLRVRYFAQDQENKLWLSSKRDIFYYDEQQKINHHTSLRESLSTEQHDVITSLLIVGRSLLIGTSRGLFILNTQTGELSPFFFNPACDPAAFDENMITFSCVIKDIVRDRDNNLLIATLSGLYRFPVYALTQDKGKPIPLTVLDDSLVIRKMIKDHGNKLAWLATTEGLFSVDSGGKITLAFRYDQTPYMIVDNTIEAMIIDKNGVFWLASLANGVLRWVPPNYDVTHYTAASKLPLSHSNLWAIAEDNHGGVWAGTENGATYLNRNNGVTKHFFTVVGDEITQGLGYASTFAVEEDTLWVATTKGLKKINTSTLMEETVLGYDRPDVERILKNKQNQIYLLTPKTLSLLNDEGMYFYNTETGDILPSDTNNLLTTRPELKPLRIISAVTAHAGEFYVSLYGGLGIYSQESDSVRMVHRLTNEDESDNMPDSILELDETLWITYPGSGVYVIDRITGKEIKHLNHLNGLKDNNPYVILPDENGYVWVTSDSGAVRISSKNYHTRLFSIKEGFPIQEYNASTGLVLSTGEYALGGINGLSFFSPQQENRRKKTRAKNNITGVDFLSSPQPKTYGLKRNKHFSLSSSDFGINVTFSSFDYANIDHVTYKYWIDGANAVASTPVNDGKLHIPKLLPGDSVLNISTIDHNTGLESKPEKIHLHVSPPAHLTTEAYTIYIATGLTLIIVIYFNRHKRRLKLLLSNRRLKHHEERLTLALESNDSGIWDWRSEDDSVYDLRVMIDPKKKLYFYKRWLLMHQEDQASYKAKWVAFLAGDNTRFVANYRLRLTENVPWSWYRDIAQVSETNDEGEPKRVTGTHTNITESKTNSDRIELFSEAFESTRDVVVITDAELTLIAVNQAYYQKTGKEYANSINKKVRFLHRKGNVDLLDNVADSLGHVHHWEGEALFSCVGDDALPVLVNATMFETENHTRRYVFAITDISEQKKAEIKLMKLANYDPLTNLPNRSLVMDRIMHALDHNKRTGLSSAVFFIDLDRFKQINDTLGHDIGDLLLMEVARILQACVRQDDTVSRLGGDEFVILMESLEDMGSVCRVAQDILKELSNITHLNGHPIVISGSIGIALSPEDASEADDVLKRADMAMYHAKNSGKNNFQYYQASMNDAAHLRVEQENLVRNAIVEHEICLGYQPQVCLNTGEIVGVEALARWTSKEGEVFSPDGFIQIAEDIGMITELTEQFLAQALAQLEQWQAMGSDIVLAINLSAKHMENNDLIGVVTGLLASHKIDPQRLEFEMTESKLMSNMDIALNTFKALNELGIDMALDDFGTGYSSLKYLSQLPVQKLKIDRSFVAEMNDNANGDVMIETILTLANNFKLKSVAEGIETPEQLLALRNLGCMYGQGYLFSHPVSAEEITPLLFAHYSLDSGELKPLAKNKA
jgi:diguanylate cyclase (GGDEF)-like protein/PAS domain S-box-containing protein